MSDIFGFSSVAVIIKDAIVRSRYQAAKLVNRELLGLYYTVGRYVSENSRGGTWGRGAIKQLSESLQRELPGLRGFGEVSLKKMRLFYEAWQPVFSSRQLLTDDLDKHKNENRQLINDDFQVATSAVSFIDLGLFSRHITQFVSPGFSVDAFIGVGFSHHSEILAKEKSIVEFAVRDYTKPMGVTTYRTQNEMSETWQNTLPDADDKIKLLDNSPDEQESVADE